jgi:UDP-N-acetylglucosamine--N-acetylmuramyl-(pentapeptide) pyrophosphoryl-undecaprenol N-acetylglucosamine transferase
LRLLIAGGGTAGHITPGLAVVEALKQRTADLRILWIGVSGRKEEDLVPKYNIPLQTMQLRGLERSISPGSFVRNTITAMQWLLGLPVWRARGVIREYQPDFVLSTGGYVCAPVAAAARIMGIRSWILEQNAIPGLTVKLLARIADGVGIAYESTRILLPKTAHIELVGNPISEYVLKTTKAAGISEYNLDPELKTLLVTGGSLGSETLNRAIIEMLKINAKKSHLNQWQILHSSGERKYKDVRSNTPQKNNYHLHPYLYRPDAALAAADLVLCRGGAMTLAEITARGVPAIVVPWPGAVNNHQLANAKALQEDGACVMIRENELTGLRLASIIAEMTDYPEKLVIMAEKSKNHGKPDAAGKVADIILSRGSNNKR